MTMVGFIGSGNIGGTVARLSVAAGHQVVLSNSRGPATLAGLVDELGPLARAATAEEAAAASQIVVVSVPFKAYDGLPARQLAGRVVLDTSNYYPERDGHYPTLDDGIETSSELLQHELAGAVVVKAFNNIFYKHLSSLARPARAADRSYLPIAGDDPDAKAEAARFIDSIGYGVVDTGDLRDSWRQEPGTPVYGAPYGSFSDEAGTPASEAVIREALSKAGR
jgi:8-hydroxy-5-deazaflavin:NADPH oxidoreductase